MHSAHKTTRAFKAGDRVRLFSLDGVLHDEVVKLTDVWDEGAAHNASYYSGGGIERSWHTDLMKHEDDQSPVVVPDGGVWYIAIGNNHGWSRAKTEKQALANMRAAGRKVTAWVLYRVSRWTTVNGMGGLNWPIGIKPVELNRVEPRKARA